MPEQFEKSDPTVAMEMTGSHMKEVGNIFPEFIANEPLENTSLVFCVPTMCEWHNGNLLRLLQSMFSQRLRGGQAFELEIISNVGQHLDKLIETETSSWESKKDANGSIVLASTPQNDSQRKALELLAESKKAVTFLKDIIEVQALARVLLHSPKNIQISERIAAILSSPRDPRELTVLRLALSKADQISLTVVDATHTYFFETDYHTANMSSLRTLGADVARARYISKPSVVMSMFDADTVAENNHTIDELQKIFGLHPELNYLFSAMTNLPAGHSKDFISDAPRENIHRTSMYNRNSAHGSPQLSFRLRAYDRLKELSGWSRFGFNGDEDRDTSYRLIYHFGALQDGLLLEQSSYLLTPTFMTADRQDGNFDSSDRKITFGKNGIMHLTTDAGQVIDFKERVDRLILEQTPEKQQEISHALETARQHFKRKQAGQQRFNRFVLNRFLRAIDEGLITHTEAGLQIEEKQLLSQTGGNALLHYIRMNEELVRSTLSASGDLQALRFFSGQTPEPPRNPTSPFQLAMREYVGQVLTLDELISAKFIECTKASDSPREEWHVLDLREPGAQVSIMHALLAELLALAHIYKTYFETKAFLATRSNPDFLSQWPADPADQELDMQYAELTTRLQNVNKHMKVRGAEVQNVGPQTAEQSWLQQVDLAAFPIFKLFKNFFQQVSKKKASQDSDARV